MISPADFVKLCGSYSLAIDAIMIFHRTLWDLIICTAAKEPYPNIFRSLHKKDWQQKFRKTWQANPAFSQKTSAVRNKILKAILANLQADHLHWELKNGQDAFQLNLFRPFSLARKMLGGYRPDHELRYFVLRNIRTRYDHILSSKTAHYFHLFANGLNAGSNAKSMLPHAANRSLAPKRRWKYTEFREYLETMLSEEEKKTQLIDFFIECNREVGNLTIAKKPGEITFRNPNIDAEHLLVTLYGMPTGIRGFDELFGSGGLMLAEGINAAHPRRLTGRTILIMGRFGTGKTLLSLQLAVDVARKGGLAWVMPLEQAAEEYLYMLGSMGIMPMDDSMEVVTDLNNAARVLQKRVAERGALIITPTIKESFEDFLLAFTKDAKRMQRAGLPFTEQPEPAIRDVATAFQQSNGEYPLRLLCVDPFNSISRHKMNRADLRTQTLAMLGEVKNTGANIILVAEEGGDQQRDLLFEQNIADTVIRLSVDRQHDYVQRYFEITKSRLQREHRGRHHFSIKAGIGIKIFPSSAAVRARVRARVVRPPGEPISFGLPSLDDILGKDALYAGDVIALQGPRGAFKTPLGLIFLLGTDLPRYQSTTQESNPQHPARSLLIAVRDSQATIKHILSQEFICQQIRANRHLRKQNKNQTSKTIDDIRICTLSSGHVNPGHIFQQIEDEFIQAQLEGYRIDRVMVDNVAHWEMSCPVVRDDETFGDTLIDYLRRHGVTSLLTCGDISSNRPSVIQQPIIDGADCILQFGQFEYRGINRIRINALKTRGMRHRRESFELTLGPRSLEVQPSSSLLRIKEGQVTPVKIRMFLHSENVMQREYNSRLENVAKSVLSPEAKIEVQEGIYVGRTMRLMSRAMQLGSSSSIDELQIFQLDEFQMPEVKDHDLSKLILHTFPASQWENDDWPERDDFLPALLHKGRTPEGTIYAIPFYENISLLAFQKNLIDPTDVTDWEKIVEQCKDWENRHPDPKAKDYLFFDFPRATVEHYNCLFFEILSTFAGPPPPSGECGFLTWLRHDDAHKAGRIFRRLCRRAYLNENHTLHTQEIVRVSKNAVVWRHWYSTLNQMLHEMNSTERENIQVTSLPGQIAIAGEWYLGLPAYSAAPDIGLEVIKLITSREAELDRLRSGVGLPVRSSFYQAAPDYASDTASPYFAMNIGELGQLITNALRRSDFGCYAQLSDSLAFHLQRIIELPDNQVEEGITHLLKSLEGRMKFIRPHRDCSKCRNRNPTNAMS